MGQGGLRINMIPKDGGNTFRGTVFANWTGDSWNGDNLTADLEARGLTNVSEVQKIYDFNPSFGGPIKREQAVVPGDVPPSGAREDGRRQLLRRQSRSDSLYAQDLTRPGIDDG